MAPHVEHAVAEAGLLLKSYQASESELVPK